MANADRPQGFKPFGRVLLTRKMESGAEIFPGDFVTLAADGQVDSASAGGDIFGLALSYASAAGEDVMVSVHPEQAYSAQADESDVNVQTDIGNIVDILATAGDSTYKHSRQEINSDTIGTGSGGQLVVLGIEERPDNAFGEFVDVIVKVNEHQAYGEDDFAGI